jgi:hypothetical protein
MAGNGCDAWKTRRREPVSTAVETATRASKSVRRAPSCALIKLKVTPFATVMGNRVLRFPA